IYRDIPYVYDQKDGKKYCTQVSVDKVLQDGNNVTYKVYTNGSYDRIQIGNADKTISGKHTYMIAYSVTGVLQNFGTYDEFYWNVTGDQWGVVMNSASARVSVPSTISLLGKTACYKGVEGSLMNCSAVKIDDHIADFSTGLLGSMEGMTIAVAYPTGIVPLLTVERPKTLFEKLMEPASISLFSIVFFGGIFWVVSTWYKQGRDIRIPGFHETMVVEFTPPENLRPAELGILMDERADTLDVTATIIDLTTRGYLTITEIPKKWLFGSTDYELSRTEKESSGLLSYEDMLLHRIFGSVKKKKVSTLKNDFYDDLAKVKENMYTHMMERGVFVDHPEKTRTKYMFIGIFFLVFGVVLTILGGANEYALLISFDCALIPVGITTVIFSRSMSRRTAKGRELYRRVKGYREFINTAEKYRQRFFEKKNLFQEVLPYAIVFGLTGKFADAMKEIGLKAPTVAGYYGIHPFNAHTFSNDVNAFSNSFSSAAASTPSSSGSGGGGSSGGGFGGGGGGSW
ncbi:MAG: DUF2207 domain-containing protein, partial [Candidatus Levybacteria bacterium]|nr:DUF2207 domain-containing protein [Candidatus Levybacteria bacterium]